MMLGRVSFGWQREGREEGARRVGGLLGGGSLPDARGHAGERAAEAVGLHQARVVRVEGRHGRAVERDGRRERVLAAPLLAGLGLGLGGVVGRRAVPAGEEARRGREERGVRDDGLPGVC